MSSRSDGTLVGREYHVHDGTEVRVFDVIRLELRRPRPEPHQPENWVVAKRPWRLLQRPAGPEIFSLLSSHLAPGPYLLGNPLDRVPHEQFTRSAATASLALVMPGSLRWHIIHRQGRRQTRVMFALAGVHYDLALTDPVWESRLASFEEGTYPVSVMGMPAKQRVLLTISLGEPFEDGCCYKLVAGVLPIPAFWTGVRSGNGSF